MRGPSRIALAWPVNADRRSPRWTAVTAPPSSALPSFGREVGRPTKLATLAAAYGKAGRTDEALALVAEALALVEGRDYAIPDDVKRLAVPVFAHRVVVNARAALTQRRSDLGDRIIEEILSQVDVPL